MAIKKTEVFVPSLSCAESNREKTLESRRSLKKPQRASADLSRSQTLDDGLGFASHEAMTRSLIAASFVAILVSMSCSGGSPSSPSGAGAATITGTVVAAGTGTASAGIPTTNVSVAGAPIASPVDASGSFRLGGVPTGDVQLVFSGSGSGSAPSVSLSNVMDRETIDLRVAIAGGTATVQSEVRGNGAGKLVLCHREGNGGYHPIDVSVNAETAHRAHGDATPGEPVPADPTKVFDVHVH